jgi:hypothetical protein
MFQFEKVEALLLYGPRKWELVFLFMTMYQISRTEELRGERAKPEINCIL